MDATRACLHSTPVETLFICRATWRLQALNPPCVLRVPQKMTPPIKDLLPRLTPILKNRQEKVQENCIDLVGRIADRCASANSSDGYTSRGICNLCSAQL